MKSIRLKVYSCLIFGIFIGYYSGTQFFKQRKFDVKTVHSNYTSDHLHDSKLAELLFKEVKLFCWVFTHPPNHEKKSIHVRNTWGKRCNKLIFISSKKHLGLEIAVIPAEESRSHLWNKTQNVYRYVSGISHQFHLCKLFLLSCCKPKVHKHFINDYDFFLRADDDKWVCLLEELTLFNGFIKLKAIWM